MNEPLYLMTTVGCTLCDKAKEQLWPIIAEFGLTLIEVDIIDHPRLLEEYATVIPVLSPTDPRPITPTSALAWPFDTESIRTWYEPFAN